MRCLALGCEPLDMPIRRLFNVAYVAFIESLPDPIFDQNDTRRKYVEALAWPEERQRMNDERQHATAREAASAIGSPASDAEFQRAWDARQAALAEVARKNAEQAMTEEGQAQP